MTEKNRVDIIKINNYDVDEYLWYSNEFEDNSIDFIKSYMIFTSIYEMGMDNDIEKYMDYNMDWSLEDLTYLITKLDTEQGYPKSVILDLNNLKEKILKIESEIKMIKPMKINKSVVSNTNKSDVKYHSTTVKNMKSLKQSIKENGSILIETKIFNTIQDKKNNQPTKTFTSTIKGIRSRGKDGKTNNYRYEMILQNISNNTNYNNTKSDRKAA
jgi:hypothetical protein